MFTNGKYIKVQGVRMWSHMSLLIDFSPRRNGNEKTKFLIDPADNPSKSRECLSYNPNDEYVLTKLSGSAGLVEAPVVSLGSQAFMKCC